MNAGDEVLDGLELGSRFTWDLAHEDLLGRDPYYDRGASTPYVAVFIGNAQYEGISSVANDPGTDGTVRWSGCGLNTRKITVDLTRTPISEDGQPVSRVTLSPWSENRLDIPMIAVEGRNHATLISNPEDQMTQLIVDFLKISEPGGETYDAWLNRAKVYRDRAIGKMLVNPGRGAAGAAGEVKSFFGHLFNTAEELMGAGNSSLSGRGAREATRCRTT
jgi:hypothetical protein